MFKKKSILPVKGITALGLTSTILCSTFSLGTLISPLSVSASPGFFEYQWDPDPSYKRLKYYQSSSERMDRASYFLFLRPKDRRKGILKLTIKVPDYFDTKLAPKKLSLCKVKIGGFTDRTRCIENIPALVEINDDQTTVEIFPEAPIPSNKDSYAVVMKIFNPRKRGMFQLQALSQAPGDVPLSLYLGTWNIAIQ